MSVEFCKHISGAVFQRTEKSSFDLKVIPFFQKLVNELWTMWNPESYYWLNDKVPLKSWLVIELIACICSMWEYSL